MSDTSSLRIAVGSGSEGRDIAVLVRPGGRPGLFFLPGFRSEMTGTKAEALDAFAAREGHAMTRFDYSGLGQSGGDFLDGTISRWLEEALAVFGATAGEQIVVGSSMGGWLALLLNRALRARGEGRIRALILIAPAVDMTEELIRANLTPAAAAMLARTGKIGQPSQYSPDLYPITARLLDDGAAHLLLGGVIETGCPITILQGGKDPDVPPEHALRLVSHLLHDPVTLTLIPDGDHRLSRAEDLARLEAAVRLAIEE